MKIIVEATWKKNNFVHCTRCQIYGHTKTTAPYRMSALSVGANTIRPCAHKTQQPQLRVPYVAGKEKWVTKDILCTKIYRKQGVNRWPNTQYRCSNIYYSSQHQRCQSIPPFTSQPAPLSCARSIIFFIFPYCHTPPAADQHDRTAVHLP